MLESILMNDPPSEPRESAHDAAIAAVRAGDIERLRTLLDQDTPATLCNDAGDSLLMLAAYHGHESCVAHLLERGAECGVRSEKESVGQRCGPGAQVVMLRADLVSDLRRSIVGSVEHGDPSPLGGESTTERAPDPAAPSGHQHGRVLESLHQYSSIELSKL